MVLPGASDISIGISYDQTKTFQMVFSDFINFFTAGAEFARLFLPENGR